MFTLEGFKFKFFLQGKNWITRNLTNPIYPVNKHLRLIEIKNIQFVIYKNLGNLGMENEGRFAGVPHEMTDKLMGMALNSREWRLIMFFIRYLQGYQMKQRVIKTGFIIEKTGLWKQHLIPTIKSLIEKGIIERRAAIERGEYIYQWNENFFERTHATSEVRIDPKVTNLMTYKNKVTKLVTSMELSQLPQGNQVSDLEVTKSVTSKDSERAAVAAERGPKDSIKERNKILKKESQVDTSSEWDPNGPEKAREILRMVRGSVKSMVL